MNEVAPAGEAGGGADCSPGEPHGRPAFEACGRRRQRERPLRLDDLRAYGWRMCRFRSRVRRPQRPLSRRVTTPLSPLHASEGGPRPEHDVAIVAASDPCRGSSGRRRGLSWIGQRSPVAACSRRSVLGSSRRCLRSLPLGFRLAVCEADRPSQFEVEVGSRSTGASIGRDPEQARVTSVRRSARAAA